MAEGAHSVISYHGFKHIQDHLSVHKFTCKITQFGETKHEPDLEEF